MSQATHISNTENIDNYITESKPKYEKLLKEFVDIPSVSAEYTNNTDKNTPMFKMALKAKETLEAFNFKAHIYDTKLFPVVCGTMIQDEKYPTVLIYNHLDVQPACAEEWNHAPFDMQIKDGKYLGRGATDDKGPALTVLFAAKYVQENKIPINIKVIWELEEEIGSPSFDEFLDKNKNLFKTDSIVVSDTIWISRDNPAVAYGLRGLQGATIKITTGVKDIHSGTTGGLARNPIGEICDIIDRCYDPKTGHVKFPGFYDDVKEPSPEEVEHFVNSGFSIANFKKAHEVNSVRTENQKEAVLRLWGQPTFEIHGITGGYTGPGIKTIVPHSAQAKISMRLVPNQDPAKIMNQLTSFVKSLYPDAVIETEGTLLPYVSDFNSTYMKAANNAVKETFNKDAVFVREGGSIGAAISMNKILNAPIVFLGLSLPEHGYHSINEYFDWQQANSGIKLFVNYFKLISDIKK